MSAILPPPLLYDSTTTTSSSPHPEILVPRLARLHMDCVRQDHMVATIRDTSSPEKFRAYWRARFGEAGAGSRVIFVQLASSEEEKEEDDEDRSDGDGVEVAGVVMLNMSPGTETGPFRCEVEKLMTSPRHRRKGIARALMGRLEEEARGRGKYLLLLDTEIGSGADVMYPKMGYTAVGVVPKYGISPKDGRLVDEVFFYKDIRDETS